MPRVVRTTIALPEDILNAVDEIIRRGEARSRNEHIARVLRHDLSARERSAVDAAFAEMSRDHEFRREALSIAKEFSNSDWEAMQLGEQT